MEKHLLTKLADTVSTNLEEKMELVTSAIGDDRKLLVHFESELAARPTDIEKLRYCRNFYIYIDNHRSWAHKHLWFVKQ